MAVEEWVPFAGFGASVRVHAQNGGQSSQTARVHNAVTVS
jgi:hypothetical protein